MRTDDVLQHYGTRRRIADALGISPAAVYKWRDRVPPLSASRLHELTNGALHFSPSDYGDYYATRRATDAPEDVAAPVHAGTRGE